ncbi:MAG: hypothetical protein RL681_445 [Candidatus Parcubacteria bacterium]|jgi:hypothetical protein
MNKQHIALIITLIFTALFVKNIIMNALSWRGVMQPERTMLLQF